MDTSHNLLIVNLTTEPFKRHAVSRFRFNRDLNFPVRLRNKLFDFLCLVNTETKSGRLARAIGDRGLLAVTANVPLDASVEFLRLVTRERHANFEIQDLARVNRNRFVEIGLVAQILLRLDNIFGRD